MNFEDKQLILRLHHKNNYKLGKWTPAFAGTAQIIWQKKR